MKFIIMCFFIMAISGCDTRTTLEKSDIRFSIGGIELGKSVTDLQKEHTLGSCTPFDSDHAKCTVDDSKVIYKIFGKAANFISIKTTTPNTNITGISFSLKGPAIYKGNVEKRWHLQGRCLTIFEIEEATKFDGEGSGYFKKALADFSMLPTGNSGFICLTANREFLKYTYDEDRKIAYVDMYYLKDAFFKNYEYIYQSKEKFDHAKNNVNNIINKGEQKGKDASSRLSDNSIVEEMNCKEVEANFQDRQKMETLAKKANLLGAYINRYHIDIISSMCKDDVERIIKDIENGFVEQGEAKRIASVLGKHFSALDKKYQKIFMLYIWKD